MESKSSSLTTNPTFLVESVVDNDSNNKNGSTSVGGRKAGSSDNNMDVAELMEVSSNSTELTEEELMMMEEEDAEGVYDSEEEDDDEEDDDDDDDDFEEFMKERKWILEDAKNLKALADFFAHPEKPVIVDGFAKGRSFFGRPSADEFLDEDAEDERDAALADALALKKLAVDFSHPERALEVDATACARNYFSQPWATQQETFGAAEERILAVQQAKSMAKTAHAYQHPEEPVKGWENPAVMGRNYFERPSAVDAEEEAERALILQEMKSLKQLANLYQHPEAPLEVDPAAFGRNYFNRASAAEQEEDEYGDDREIILEEMKELKEAAVMHRHPELPVEVDATACARNYFTRPSAPEQEEDEYTDDREIILEEMKELKEAAVLYRHPEMPLDVHAAVWGRNYFDRASAEDQDVDEEERAAIMKDLQALKSLAVDYRHPERPVQVDATACARNYFTRPSAPLQEDDEVDEERQEILEEMALMKQQAAAYLHPERPLSVDPTCFGRNYYGRASAEDKETFGAAEERARIIAEAAMLKRQATVYMHPELPLEIHSAAVGRNYFERPSAEDFDENDEERAQVLKDMAELKKLAVDFLHPERPVVCEDPCAFGRNYFERASAIPQEEEELTDEREEIFEELAELKRLAVDFSHPERPVVYEDPCAFGRNYFGRASATEQEEDELAEEREAILEEMAELKQSVVDYMHPERPVPTADPASFGRNYFERSFISDAEDAPTERELVMADAVALYKLAVHYAHPELPVKTTDATVFGRNYFSRPSAPEGESYEEAEERARILADAQALKKTAEYFSHPEMPMTTDPTVFARNYFSRASAPQQESVEDFMERAQILAEAAAFKKVSNYYLHPELPVVTSDSTVCGRNYFVRASAAGAADHIRSEGFANPSEHAQSYVEPEEHSHHDVYGHFDMDEDIFYDMRQSIVLPMTYPTSSKVQSNKIGSDEEGELSRSPSSVMLFTGAIGEDDFHPPLPSMG